MNSNLGRRQMADVPLCQCGLSKQLFSESICPGSPRRYLFYIIITVGSGLGDSWFLKGLAQSIFLLLFKKLLGLLLMISTLFSPVMVPPGFLMATTWVFLTDDASAPPAFSSTQFLRPALGLTYLQTLQRNGRH